MRATEDQLKAWMISGLDGDARAHAALLRAITPLLQSFYRRRMRGGIADIEDLVQETLIAVHNRRASYDRDRAFTAWLFAIARYKMIDHLRESHPHDPIEGLEEILVAEGFEQRSNARKDVDSLLGELPVKQARAIRDTRIEGLSIAEAASRWGLGESDMKISVHRGLKTLAARIVGGGK